MFLTVRFFNKQLNKRQEKQIYSALKMSLRLSSHMIL